MTSQDAPPSLYAAHEPIFPRRVKGTFRTLKWVIMIVTLGIYYITPWIRWDRGPTMPDQAVLVDLANRRFFFFMIEIWPHEFYFVAGLLIMAGLGLFLFTSALGRVWCGYACPQTVWTDLFILVERWIEGDRNARVRLYHQKWNGQKIGLRAIKYSVWFLIALATGGAWIFYFTDAPTLLYSLIHGTAHPVAYITMGVLTFTTFFFGGFAREQICIYACPWPRIQAAMMDEDTLVVGYRWWRGEPRGKLRKGAPVAERAAEPPTGLSAPAIDLAGSIAAGMSIATAAAAEDRQGDCIDCMACVNVCPMGIDIRNGQQMECITCALCIDACDEVMDRIGRPRNLIGYMALKDEIEEQAGGHPRNLWRHIFRPRTILYTTLWTGIGVALVVALFMRSPIGLNVTPIRNPLFITMSDGAIRNAYELRLHNKHGDKRQFHISVTADQPLEVSLEGRPEAYVDVPADATVTQRVYVTAPAGSPAADAGRIDMRFWVLDLGQTEERVSYETVFNGKGR